MGARMRRILCLSLALTACAHASTSTAPHASSETERLNAFVDAEWSWYLESYPETATAFGDLRSNDKLTDLSTDAVRARKDHAVRSLAALRELDRAALDERAQVTYDVMAFDLETAASLARFPAEVIQLTHMGGIHTAMADLAGYAPKRTRQQVEQFIARLRAAPAQLTQATALLAQGLAVGVTPPRETLTKLPALVRMQIPADVTKSPIYLAYFADLPAELPEREALQRRGAETITSLLYPAYEQLAVYLETTYVPQSRTTLGWTSVPDGEAWYQAKIREQTTLELDAEAIHAIGLDEVERIGKAMEELKNKTGFTGDMPAFFAFLRSDPRFFYGDADALVRGYRDIAKRIDEQLPTLFGKLPRNPYGVEPVPAFAEQVQPTAYYQPGSVAAGRAGIFYCNTYNLASRPRWEMEALTMHESVPGHHLQMALAEEVEGVPVYRKYAFNNAFIEGWGLYAESLGERIGLYKDPYAKFGQLTYEMWRAVRLVVDTGMHAKGWSRTQAIDYFAAHAGKPKHDIAIEVDRYVAWPAQALGYKLGQLELMKLRQSAQDALGDRFDIRAFHDLVLSEGTLPLTVLEARVTHWLEGQR